MAPRLSKEAIVTAAFQLLEETPDLDKLSMRKVATKLAVQAPAIYWYFENKQALLQSMAERIEEEFQTPTCSDNWHQTLIAYMENYYDLYRKYPCAVEIEVHTVPSYPKRLENINALIGILRKAGFPVEISYIAVTSLQHLLFGLLLDDAEEQKLFTQVLAGDCYLTEQVQQMKEYVVENNLTHMQESIQFRKNKPQKESFLTSVELFLAGLEKLKN